MDPLKLRAHLFGSLLEDVDKLGDVCLDDEAYAHAIYALFSKSSQEDSPAADLFRREKWHDLQALLYTDRPASAIFSGTCMRRALVNRLDVDDVVTRILGILDNDCTGEVVTKALALQSAGSWEELVGELAPYVTSENASTIAWQLKRISVDPDGLIDAIDVDGAAGKICPLDAVERIRDVYYGTRFLRAAVEDLVKKLLPKVPPEFRAGTVEHFVTELLWKPQTVINVTETRVVARAPEPVPAVTEDQVQALAWDDALVQVAQLAKLIEPLTKAGLSSSDALEVANTMIGEARLKQAAKLQPLPEAAPERPTAPRLSGLARHFGASILDID